jgi:hypothetical protein
VIQHLMGLSAWRMEPIQMRRASSEYKFANENRMIMRSSGLKRAGAIIIKSELY